MPTSLLPALLLPLLLCCGSSATHPATSPLDYVELQTPDGWYLRVRGDGSGSLTHRQHPLHHLDYPTGTFQTGELFQTAAQVGGRGRRCGVGQAAGSYRLEHYRARQDTTLRQLCMAGRIPQHAMHTAIARMQSAVDDLSSERSCRMLRRTWLAAN